MRLLLGRMASGAGIGIGRGGSGSFNLMSNSGFNNNGGLMMVGMGLITIEPLGIILHSEIFFLNY